MRVDLVICDFGYLMVELYSEQGKKNPAIAGFFTSKIKPYFLITTLFIVSFAFSSVMK